MEDTPRVGVGDSSPSGGLFSNKRNLLIMAAVLGGGAGLVLFLMRRSTPSSDVAGNTPGGSVSYSAGDLSIQSLATQLLQFRGEQSQANADLGSAVSSAAANQAETGTNIATALTANQTSVMAALAQLLGIGNLLGGQLTAVGGQVAGVGNQVAGVSGQVSGVSGQVSGINNLVTGVSNQIGDLSAQNQNTGVVLFNQSEALRNLLNQWGVGLSNQGNLIANQGALNQERFGQIYDMVRSRDGGGVINPIDTFRSVTATYGRTPDLARPHVSDGAGGFSADEQLGGVWDGGDGAGTQWRELMSSGPVRRI